VWGTFLGTRAAFFARSVQKTEGKRDKATVSLTVAFSNAVGQTAAFVKFHRKIG
jgi:hypothetical protein